MRVSRMPLVGAFALGTLLATTATTFTTVARADVPPPRAGCSLGEMKKGQECVDCRVHSSLMTKECEKQLEPYGFTEVCADWGYMHGIYCRPKSGDGKPLPAAIASAVGGKWEPSETPPPEPTTTASAPATTSSTTGASTRDKTIPAAAPSSPTKTGCGACATGSRPTAGDGALGLSIAFALLVGARRRARG